MSHNRTGPYKYLAIAEEALGYPLPKGSEVHHFDEDRSNNSRGNLVICQDKAYHKLLHARRRAQLECGNPAWRKCTLCKQYDDPIDMALWKGRQTSYIHRSCYQQYKRDLVRKHRARARAPSVQ